MTAIPPRIQGPAAMMADRAMARAAWVAIFRPARVAGDPAAFFATLLTFGFDVGRTGLTAGRLDFAGGALRPPAWLPAWLRRCRRGLSK